METKTKLTPREREYWAYWTAPADPDSTYYSHYSRLDMLQENVSEHEAENRSETAMFGDSGPGTALSLSKAKAYLGRVERRLAAIRAKMEPPAMPSTAAPAVIDDDDIPF